MILESNAYDAGSDRRQLKPKGVNGAIVAVWGKRTEFLEHEENTLLEQSQGRPISYQENYIESIRNELVATLEQDLTPVALRYQYTETPLEENIKWRPVVLVLGNYSSGKSTLINELLGAEIQTTGQAPTDDSFTVITYRDSAEAENATDVDLRDGKVLLNDERFPFASLRRHGQRFAAHFRLKSVASPFLKNLALIDTPGMVDSVSERDRGYNYQEVIADFARIADLILVLFDPHKAGTIRETYESLRQTLPQATYEDRVLFVLNRIDECTNLNDLLRVYGTLCWNLSQMTGRKDIPQIHLTYSPEAATAGPNRDFLGLLKNERAELKQNILNAPRHRLDHLATYIEEHGDTLGHFLEALVAYSSRRRQFVGKYTAIGFGLALVVGLLAYWFLPQFALTAQITDPWLTGVAGVLAAAGFLIWLVFVKSALLEAFHRRVLRHLDRLTPLDTQSRKDSWLRVKPMVERYLVKTGGRFSGKRVRHDFKKTRASVTKASREARKALSEVGSVASYS